MKQVCFENAITACLIMCVACSATTGMEILYEVGVTRNRRIADVTFSRANDVNAVDN